MISPRDIIEYIEKITGKNAVLDANGDEAPYNGTTSNLSYDTTKARQTGFRFSDSNEWIFDLIKLYL